MTVHFHIRGCGCFDGESIGRRQLLKGGILAVAASAMPPVFGQERLNADLAGSCSFYPEDELAGDIYTFQNNDQAIAVVTKLTRAVGLRPNFQVMQANVPNAAAVIQGSERYILYSQVFIDEINRQTASEWSSWTILAHEIAHHLNGHTLDGLGSRPDKELEADWWAGHAVAKIGGTLEQALGPFRTMSDEGSNTHPGRAARLESVTGGWHEGNGPVVVDPDTDPNPTVVAGATDAIDAVTRLFQAIASGSPAPFAMTSEMKNAYDSQLGQAQMMIRAKGALQDVSLINQAPAQGGTMYYFVATFASGTMQGQVGLLQDGTVGAFYFQ